MFYCFNRIERLPTNSQFEVRKDVKVTRCQIWQKLVSHKSNLLQRMWIFVNRFAYVNFIEKLTHNSYKAIRDSSKIVDEMICFGWPSTSLTDKNIKNMKELNRLKSWIFSKTVFTDHNLIDWDMPLWLKMKTRYQNRSKIINEPPYAPYLVPCALFIKLIMPYCGTCFLSIKDL